MDVVKNWWYWSNHLHPFFFAKTCTSPEISSLCAVKSASISSRCRESGSTSNCCPRPAQVGCLHEIYISSWVLYSLFPSFFERPWQLRGVLLPLEMRLNCFLQVIPTNWHFICILSGILCGKYSAISSDLLCDRYCDILADNLSGIFSGIYSAMFSDIYFDNLLHIDIYSGSLALFYLALHLAFYLSFLKILSDIWLTFYLTSYSDILTFYPTFVWHSVRVGATAQAVQLPSWSGSATSKIPRCWKFHIHLVGGIPTPLKNMKVSWEGWHPIYEMENKKMFQFQTTNQSSYSGFHHSPNWHF